MTAYGNWTLDCSDGFTPAELTEAVADVSESLELRFVGGLGRAQAGFVDEAKKGDWVHFTLWDPAATGLVLTFERDAAAAPVAGPVEVETEIAEGFEDDAVRRGVVADLATRIVNRACEKLGMRVTAFDAK